MIDPEQRRKRLQRLGIEVEVQTGLNYKATSKRVEVKRKNPVKERMISLGIGEMKEHLDTGSENGLKVSSDKESIAKVNN